MNANEIEYEMMFGEICNDFKSMAKCACVACNSCTCACSCHMSPDLEEIEW